MLTTGNVDKAGDGQGPRIKILGWQPQIATVATNITWSTTGSGNIKDPCVQNYSNILFRSDKPEFDESVDVSMAVSREDC